MMMYDNVCSTVQHDLYCFELESRYGDLLAYSVLQCVEFIGKGDDLFDAAASCPCFWMRHANATLNKFSKQLNYLNEVPPKMHTTTQLQLAVGLCARERT